MQPVPSDFPRGKKLARAKSRGSRKSCPDPSVCVECSDNEACIYLHPELRHSDAPRDTWTLVGPIIMNYSEVFSDFYEDLTPLVSNLLTGVNCPGLVSIWETWLARFNAMARTGEYEHDSMRVGYVAAITDLLGLLLTNSLNQEGPGGDSSEE